ncbi:MAG: hypothetical protein ACRENG_37425, partial [bacterium]
SELAFLQGSGAPYHIAANPPLHDTGIPLVSPGSVNANGLAWSPNANVLLYTDAILRGLYQVTPGSSDGGTPLVSAESNFYEGLAER